MVEISSAPSQASQRDEMSDSYHRWQSRRRNVFPPDSKDDDFVFFSPYSLLVDSECVPNVYELYCTVNNVVIIDFLFSEEKN
jgi:hypothetical protein